jgi:hypothetical protein
MELNTPKEKFNRIHSYICNVIERSFGVLKMKWQILYKMPPYSMVTQKKAVAVTMVLHNFIREHASGDVCGVRCRALAPFILLNIMRSSSPAFSRKKKWGCELC